MAHYDCRYCGDQCYGNECKSKAIENNFRKLDVGINKEANLEALYRLEEDIKNLEAVLYRKKMGRLFNKLYVEYFREKCWLSLSQYNDLQLTYNKDGWDKINLFRLRGN